MVNAYAAKQYKKIDVEGASPIHLVVMAYDLAISSCEKKDMETSIRSISALRDALDYDYPEAAGGLLSLYNYCLDNIRNGDFDAAKHVMVELRDAWATVENRLNTSSTIVVEEMGRSEAITTA